MGLKYIKLKILIFTVFTPAKLIIGAELNTLSYTHAATLSIDTLINARSQKIAQTKSLNNGTQKIDRAKKSIVIEGISDYPQFINTGNPEKDNEDFKKRKREWIMAHPEKYKQISNPGMPSESDKREIEKKLQQNK
jgi:hypothetical protein